MQAVRRSYISGDRVERPGYPTARAFKKEVQNAKTEEKQHRAKEHVQLNSVGISRSLNGSKLGLRKRYQLFISAPTGI